MEDETLIKLTIYVEQPNADRVEADNAIHGLREELKDFDVGAISWVGAGTDSKGAKGSIDPAVLGALLIAVTPIVLSKILEFLHAWAMRREGRSIKIKFKNKESELVEVEIPRDMKPTELQMWIKAVKNSTQKEGSKR